MKSIIPINLIKIVFQYLFNLFLNSITNSFFLILQLNFITSNIKFLKIDVQFSIFRILSLKFGIIHSDFNKWMLFFIFIIIRVISFMNFSNYY